MKFERILEEWENSQRPKSVAHFEKTTEGTHWLDLYPPNGQQISEKETSRIRPANENRSWWLRRAPQDVIDLHGFTREEAIPELAQFILSMQKRKLRKGLVIHGKGNHSSEGSVLGPLIRRYLESSPDVGEFGRAKNKDGGSGATWFLLRNMR